MSSAASRDRTPSKDNYKNGTRSCPTYDIMANKLWEKNFEVNREIERFTVGRDR